jgi:hypothetical protein
MLVYVTMSSPFRSELARAFLIRILSHTENGKQRKRLARADARTQHLIANILKLANMIIND